MPDRASWRSNPAVVRRTYVAVWLALLALIWLSFAIARQTLTDSLVRELRQRLHTDTLVLEDHASRSLDSVVSRLESVGVLSASDDLRSGRLSPAKLRNLVFEDTMVRSLSLIDPQGRIVTSSNAALVGQSVSLAVASVIGPAALQPRPGVRFGQAVAQRDLSDAPNASTGAPSIWLAQVDTQMADLVGYRWLVAINPGFFQNLWAAVARQTVAQVGLFDYEGKPIVILGQGPATSPNVAKALRLSLESRDSGELNVPAHSDWQIHFRASARHPMVFMMFVERDAHLRQELQRSSALWWLAWGASLLVSVVAALFFASYLRYERSWRLNLKLQRDAQTDVLTGLSNRRGFEALAVQDLARASALGEPLSLMLMDLDHFKSINDRHGHAAGDVVLQEMARRWRALLRSHDHIARIGGEEFCLLLPGTGIEHAPAIARKLLEATRREPVVVPGAGQALPVTVTVSIGVVGLDRCGEEVSLETLMAVADSALYRAKENGRDRIEVVRWPQS